jgi:hypothetical protein
VTLVKLPGRPLVERTLPAVPFLVALVLVTRCVVVMGRAIATSSCNVRCDWSGPDYYLSYDSGFVRRALPGELLRLLGGPSHASVEVLGWTLTASALLAVLVLAGVVFRQLRGSPLRHVAAALVIVCPLSLASTQQPDERGRYDAIGIVALVVIAVLGSRRVAPRHRAWIVAAAVVVTLAAGLSEELLVAFLVLPALLLVLRLADGSPTRKTRVTAAVLVAVPVAVTAASTFSLPSAAQVAAARLGAGRLHRYDAAYFMRASLSDEVRFVGTFTRRNIADGLQQLVYTGLIWLTVFAIATGILAAAFQVRGRWFWYAAGVNAALAIALSVVGVDQRRWWTLSFLALVAATVVRRGLAVDGSGAFGQRADPRVLPGVVIASLALVGEMFFLYPLHELRQPRHSLPLVLFAILLVGAARAVFARGRGAAVVRGAHRTTLAFLAAVLVALTLCFAGGATTFLPMPWWQRHATRFQLADYWRGWLH